MLRFARAAASTDYYYTLRPCAISPSAVVLERTPIAAHPTGCYVYE